MSRPGSAFEPFTSLWGPTVTHPPPRSHAVYPSPSNTGLPKSLV